MKKDGEIRGALDRGCRLGAPAVTALGIWACEVIGNIDRRGLGDVARRKRAGTNSSSWFMSKSVWADEFWHQCFGGGYRSVNYN